MPTPYPTKRRWFRVGSIFGERAARLEVTTAAAVERLATEGTPIGAVGKAVGRVWRQGMGALDTALRQADELPWAEAMAAVAREVRRLQRRREAEAILREVLDEVRAADRAEQGEGVYRYEEPSSSGEGEDGGRAGRVTGGG